MQEVTDLVREVAETRSVAESFIKYNQGVVARLKEIEASAGSLEDLKAQVATAASELDAVQKAMEGAMVTGTVADSTQPPPDNGVDAAPNVEPAPKPVEEIVEEAKEAVENLEPEPAPPANP